ncbi:hypothetical protein RJT34_04431 [Clitoria ternatea]|uniref:Dof zinc finger protein n=1 Tax=Clitoria ternatea TaxID=43366 RepID=A0AAN9KNH8_CLITE
MEQEAGERTEEMINRQPQRQAPQHQNKRCPRCDSLNTKFCYFNNYSLSQPRHFCKSCKRYWTHGGTFRNIPIGGGSRRGKRARISSSSSSNPLLQQPQPNSTTLLRPSPSPPSLVPSSTITYNQLGGTGVGVGVRGGLLSSLAAVHSLNPSQPFTNVTPGSSNSALLSSFTSASSLQPRTRFESLYPSEQGLVPTTNIASQSGHWPQSLINNIAAATTATNQRASADASLWSTIGSGASIGGNSELNNVRGGRSSFLIPNRWTDLPRFGPQ